MLGGDELLDVFTSAGYYVYGWEDIAAEYSAFINHDNAKPLINDYKGSYPTTKADDNGYAMYLATQCTDAALAAEPGPPEQGQPAARPEVRLLHLGQRLVQRPVRLLALPERAPGARHRQARHTCRS